MAAQADNRRFLAILLGVIVIVVIAFGLARRDPEGDAGQPASEAAGSASEAATDRSSTIANGAGDSDGDASAAGTDGAATASTANEAPEQSDADGDSVIVPIPVPAEFVEVFERNEELADFHAMLEREPEDPAWASGLENYLDSHFNSSLDLSEWRVLTVECRSVSCEILATGYGDDAMRGWMQSLSQLFENEDQFEALIGGPGIGSCGGGDLAPGVFAVNCTIQRTEGEAAADETAAETETFSIETPYPDDVSIDRVAVPDFIVPAIESDADVFDLHRRLELETIDYAWAGYVEPLITDFLSSLDPERGLELVGVTCRSTLCEVQMMAQNEQVAMVEWVSTMLDFMRTEGHDLRPGAGNDETVGDGEETGIVWFLERAQENTQSPEVQN